MVRRSVSLVVAVVVLCMLSPNIYAQRGAGCNREGGGGMTGGGFGPGMGGAMAGGGMMNVAAMNGRNGMAGFSAGGNPQVFAMAMQQLQAQNMQLQQQLQVMRQQMQLLQQQNRQLLAQLGETPSATEGQLAVGNNQPGARLTAVANRQPPKRNPGLRN